VISAIINVAQEGVEEDWILEVIGHDGVAVNVTMQPGEMVLYESHSVIHGRPYPLKGKYYANVFLHFEPIGYSTWLDQQQRKRADKHVPTAQERFEEALARAQSETPPTSGKTQTTSNGSSSKSELPHYIREGTLEASRWRQEFVFQRLNLEEERAASKKKRLSDNESWKKKDGATSAHILAAGGNVAELRKIAEEDPSALDKPDKNGWKPIHGVCPVRLCFAFWSLWFAFAYYLGDVGIVVCSHSVALLLPFALRRVSSLQKPHGVADWKRLNI